MARGDARSVATPQKHAGKEKRHGSSNGEEGRHGDTHRVADNNAASPMAVSPAQHQPPHKALPPNLDDCLSACELLREALVDPGSQPASCVPLRPSLQRIQADLEQVLEEAVSSHNGNVSLLVLGPPGSGKTLVVERSLQALTARHNTSTCAGTGADCSVGVVRLNGLLQPDERSAFQEVARQLCSAFGQKFHKTATFDENLLFLKGMLHALYKALKKVVFVLDELQQYARARGKQQVLYYLLDLLQDSKIQAAVIGISSAHNVAEDLEKRVLSRVGRRRIVVTFPAQQPADDLTTRGAIGGGGAPAPAATPSAAGPSTPPRPRAAGAAPAAAAAAGAAAAEADSYQGLLRDLLALHEGMRACAGGGADQRHHARLAVAHNAALEEALADARVKALLGKLEVLGAPPQHLALAAEGALVAWGAQLRGRSACWLGAAHLVVALEAVADEPERAVAQAVAGLSVLQLVLLVAAHRLQKKGQAMCNFEMAWDEYRGMQAGRSAVDFSKPAAEAAWQALGVSGLAHYVDAHVEAKGRDLAYAGVCLLVGGPDLEEGLRLHPSCPDAVRRFLLGEV